MVARQERLKSCLPKADVPVYTIGVAARMLGVHPRTLRIYESEGLIRPQYRGARRLFSHNDIQWITCLRAMIHDDGISIPGIKKLLEYVPCWKISDCPREVHETCEASVDMAGAHCVRCGSSSKPDSMEAGYTDERPALNS